MGSLMKLANAAEKKAVEEKTVGIADLHIADRIKLGCANLYNFIGDAKEAGFHIKTASDEEEVNHELLDKTAALIVIDEAINAGIIKEAIDLKKIKEAISTFAKSRGGYATIGGLGGAGTGALVDDDPLRGALIGGGVGAGAGLGAHQGLHNTLWGDKLKAVARRAKAGGKEGGKDWKKEYNLFKKDIDFEPGMAPFKSHLAEGVPI